MALSVFVVGLSDQPSLPRVGKFASNVENNVDCSMLETYLNSAMCAQRATRSMDRHIVQDVLPAVLKAPRTRVRCSRWSKKLRHQKANKTLLDQTTPQREKRRCAGSKVSSTYPAATGVATATSSHVPGPQVRTRTAHARTHSLWARSVSRRSARGVNGRSRMEVGDRSGTSLKRDSG